jgi:hypothetical protein
MAIFPAHFSHKSCTESPLYDVFVRALAYGILPAMRSRQRASEFVGEGRRERGRERAG